ncbi:MAG: translocation/assembly module TamB domain-containing protein [Candidatus Saccharicenans sp.]|uniref:translocation/assembly module TamB domain-containing protein n=1 Tax=Candidatus Saccharicenans sp. TaxID=2819258 RepID=UPI00404B34AE
MEKENKPHKGKKRKLFRLTGWVLLSLVLLLLLVTLLLQTSWGGKFVLKQAGKIIEEKAGLILQAERLQLNLFRLKAAFAGLKISPTEKSQLPVEFISCERLILKSGWSTLIGGQLRIKNLEIIKPVVKLKAPAAAPDQQKAEEMASPEAGSSQAFSFRLDNFRLDQGTFSFIQADRPLSLDLSGIKATVNFDQERRSHRAVISSDSGSLVLGQGKLNINELEIRAAFNQQAIELERFSLSTSQSLLGISGTVDNYFDNPGLNLKTAGHLGLEEVAALLSPADKFAGQLNWNLTIAGTPTRPEVTGNIGGDQLEIYGLVPVKLNLDISQDSDAAHLIKAKASLGAGELYAESHLPPGFKGTWRASLDLRQLDLRLLQVFIPDFPVKLQSAISGLVELEARELSVTEARGQARLQLKPIAAAEPSGTRASIPISGQIDLSQAGQMLTVDKINLSVLGSHLSFKGLLDSDESISGRLSWSLEDLQSFVSNFRASGLDKIFSGLESQLPALESLKGSMGLEATVSGQISSPRFDLTLSGQNLAFRELSLPGLELKAKGNLESIALSRLLARFNQGQISGSGQFRALKDKRGSVFGLEGQVEISELDLKQLSGLLPEDSRGYLNGILNGLVRLGGTTSSPRSSFEFKLSGTEAGTARLESLEIKGQYSPNELSLEKIDLRLPEGQLQGHLAFRPGPREIKAELKGQRIKAQLFQAWLPSLKSGQVDLELTAAGFWKAPLTDLKITGQGFMIDRLWFPYFELNARADGQTARATFSVPRFNLNLESQLDLKAPYLLTGIINIRELPLSSLAGLLPEVEETSPLVALSATTRFSLPLATPENLEAEFEFQDFDFAGLSVLMPSLQSLKPGGRAAGRLVLKGFSPNFQKTDLRLEIPSLQLQLGGNEIRNEGPLTIQLQNNKLRVGNFILNSGRSRLSLSGGAELKELNNPLLDFNLNGDLDLSDFGAWLSGMQVGGKMQLKATVRGDLQKPLIEGSGSLENVFLRMQDLPLVLSDTTASFKVDNSELVLEKLEGLANSGSFSGSGRALFGQNFSLTSARIDFKLRDFDFNFPRGFNSLSGADLVLTKEKQGWLLAGEFSLLNASYREDFYPSTQGLKMALSAVSPVGTEFPAFLYELALNIDIKTVENIVVKNNLADLELKANLNLKGTIPAPILSGRLESAYTGELVVGDRKYTLERLSVDFLGRENLEPNLDIFLKSTVYDQDEEIEASLVLSGTPSDLKFSLTSVPARSQEDLASLLLTGKSLREVQGSALNTISSQLVQHFSSPLASPVTKTLKKWLKAEDVILEPLNIATLQDPGARLTIRKKMTRSFAVTYSIDLTNSQYQTWILDYRLNRNFSTRGFRRDDGVVGLNLRHRINFGQKPDSGPQAKIIKKKLKTIEISGETVFPEKQLIKVMKLKTGRSYRTSALRQAQDRLEAFFRRSGYVNARIEGEIDELEDNGLNLRLNIQSGRPAEFRFTGDKVPARARKKALGSWLGRLPEEANIYQLKAVLLNELNRRGYYQAAVSLNKIPQDGKVVYEVSTSLNGKWKIESFKLSGNPVFKETVIKKIVADYFGAKARGLWNLIYDRKIALELVEYYYQENGYLQAKIEAPLVEADFNRRRLRLQLEIEAGPRSQVSSLEISGNTKFKTEELAASLNLKPGSIFSWPALNEDRTVLVNRYRSAGFKDVRVEFEARPVDDGPDYDVRINIDEGPVYTISSLEVEGARRSRKSFVLKEAGLKPGDPVSLERLAQAQKNLYDAATFQAVNINSEPVSTAEHQEKVQIRLQEMPWFSLTYGLQYNTDTKFEGFTQLDFNNIFGRGWNSLLYFRANDRQQDARVTLQIPYLFSRKLDSLLSVYYKKDIRDLFITEEMGASLQQKIMIVRGFDLSWVYRLSRIHDYEKEPSWPLPYDVRITSSELSLLLSRDTRDDRFDPRRGTLLTSTFSYSPRYLGSDLNYIRSFTQFTMYKSLLPGVVWASCYRLGLASAFGEYLIPSKRFFAGGGTSIRGFKLDAVGPIDFWTGLPEGGEALIVVNQELRFPIYKIFKGVAFLDAGNVYSRLSDFNPGRLRTGAGFGLRVESPLGLIRIDYGFNLKPRPGEARSTLFFSIGQAF